MIAEAFAHAVALTPNFSPNTLLMPLESSWPAVYTGLLVVEFKAMIAEGTGGRL